MNAGHNSTLSENERIALFFHHLRKRKAHNAAIAEVNAAKKADAKLAKNDKVAVTDLDFAIKTIDADDKATSTDQFIQHGEILTWLNVIPGFQSDLLRDRAPAMERIEGEGKLAGLAGRDAVSPYAKGSDEDLAWLRGWDCGQAIMRDNLESAMEKINARMAGEEDDLGEEEGDPDFPAAAE